MGTSSVALAIFNQGPQRYASYQPGKRFQFSEIEAALKDCVATRDIDSAFHLKKEVMRDLEMFTEDSWVLEREHLKACLDACTSYIHQIQRKLGI